MYNYHQNSVVVSAPIVSPQPDISMGKIRRVIKIRIYAILIQKQPAAKTDAVIHKKIVRLAAWIDDTLFKSAKSLEEYSDFATLYARVDFIFSLPKIIESQRPPAATAAINGTAQCITPTHATINSFQSGSRLVPINCTTSTGGFSNGPDDLQRQQSAGANHHMVDVSRPNINQFTCGVSSPLSTGVGFSRNCEPLAANGHDIPSQELFSATHLSSLSQPIQLPDQSHMHRYSTSNVGSFEPSNYGVVMSSGSMEVAQNSIPRNPNPMQGGVDATATTYQSNLNAMQQTPIPQCQILWNNNNFQSAPNNRENLAQVSQQLLNHGFHQQARDIEHQGQHSQKLYPGQLQKQDSLLHKKAYLTQQSLSLAAPVMNEPSLYSYEGALNREATTNGFNHSKFQCQQTVVNDHYIGSQSASVHGSQMNSSPSFQKLYPGQLQKQARDIEHQGQHFQKLYPGQLHKQESLLHKKAYLTQQAMGLAAPIMNEPSLYSYEGALNREATTNGFNHSKFQCQQTVVKDHYIGSQSASVHGSQMNSSPSFQPHPHQKQSASVPVQRQPSLQNSTEVLENNNGESEHTGVNICQSTPIQPEPVQHFSSPIAPISSQTVSPGNTIEMKRLRETSTKQVNRDFGQTLARNTMRWLLLMIHARNCKAIKDKCVSKYCFEAKKTLKHIDCCKVPDCTYRYCLSTRKWFHHYKQCQKESCHVCVSVKSYEEKNKDTSVPLCRASSKRQPGQAYNKGGVDADLQPSMKRPKLQEPSQNATPETKSISVTGCGVVCKPDHSSMNMQEKDGLKSDDDCKNEVMPMDIDVPDTCGIPGTRELEKNVAEDTPKGKNCGGSTKDETRSLLAQGTSKCMNEMSASKEDNVKQSVDVVDASKMEISSLVELFTPEQVKGHIRSLRQWVGQSKTKADKNKAMGCSMSVNSCQLCAVERLLFEPIPIYCSPCGVRIKKNALYYSVAAGESSRHYVCAPCYNEAHENLISLDGTSIPKAKLEKKKNDVQVGEGWVQCDKCEAWQHQICALFNSRRNHGEATKYTCPNCYIKEVEQGERRPLSPSAIPGAKKLPVTALSNHIEERLFKKLKEERQERARLQGKSYEEVPGAESLTVRVVASVDKVLEVKERFLELFREENYPSDFPYKSKVILLFQKIENVEVCLFGMFVQEFGTESGPPNQRRVYLSYLDSVKYFRPEVRTVSGEALRTFVYHEILIGYLDYCKKRGFTSCYIWACPPLKGEDYILYCHPEIQKTPKTDKLREWYLAMLRKASKEDVVVECTNLYDHFFVQSGECRANVTAARLPYFDGDYWPGAAEDLILQMSQEDDGKNLNRKGLTKKVISKRALRAVGQLDISANAYKDRLMMQKLGATICPMKKDFIMVHLQHCCKHCSSLMVSGNRWVCNQCKNFQICDKCNEVEQNRIDKERHPINHKEKHELVPVAIKDVPAEIKDKDDNLESEFFDNRQTFLNLCQGNNYQYDTLRRAKHSSMMILYHLHNPTSPAFATFCTICQQEVENSQGWHCEVCPGYDVCSACYSNASTNHSHKLISRSSSTDSTVVQQNGQTNQVHLEELKEVLVHVAACRSKLCQYQGCHKMKMLFRHCIACKSDPGDCPHCKRFWSLIKLHARSCRDSQCTVPKCRDFRAISNRQQQQSEKRRRAALKEMVRERAAEATG